MSAYRLKFLQPAQYDSWLRKVDDPDWCEHRYRDSKDSAMVSAIRELRAALSQRAELLAALRAIIEDNGDGINLFTNGRAAIAKAEGHDDL